MKKKQRPDFKERSFGISVGGFLLLLSRGAVVARPHHQRRDHRRIGAVLLVLA
jgi:c-di-GMP-binding flagellar brake protein YcgR